METGTSPTRHSEILLITNGSETLKPIIDKETTILEALQGSFTEIRNLILQLREMGFEPSLLVVNSKGYPIDGNARYSEFESLDSHEADLQELFGAPRVILVALKADSFILALRRGWMRDVFMHADSNQSLIVVGGVTACKALRSAGLWRDSFVFAKRRGVARVGKLTQNKVIDLLMSS